jgi:glycerophosphoryl diester phosphodiesterase
MTRSRLTTLLLMIFALSTGVLASVSLADGDDDRDRDRKASSRHDERPLVIAHRGASGYRPEHTLAAYELGARMGADYVEPDLVITKDGVLVARHENEISQTTDVENHPEFADRRTTKTIEPGVTFTGWFTEDFTLAELKTLRAEERIPGTRQENTIYNGRYQVPTLQEVIDLTRRLSRELDREIGIYPETKHPSYFQQIGLPLERPLVTTLRRNGLDGRRDKVFVQSFETNNLKELEDRIDTPLVQLLNSPNLVIPGDGRTYAELATDAGLREISRYAQGVGPAKAYIVPRDAAGNSQAPTDFVRRAHRAGLVVHPWTFRNENQFLPFELRSGGGADPNAYGDAFGEYEQFYGLGVDGVFSDNPDTAVEARSGQ